MREHAYICSNSVCDVIRDLALIIITSTALASFSAKAEEPNDIPPVMIEIPMEAILKKYDFTSKIEIKEVS